jgi:transposase
MPSPYPQELRDRVISAWKQGNATQLEIAKRFDVANQTVVRWVARFRRTGSVAPAAMGGAHRAFVVDEEGAALVRGILDCNLDSTLPELCAAYEEARGVRVSPQTMSDTVRRLGYTRKRGSSGGWRASGRKP